MTDSSDDTCHFFVSFNQADRDWASWIAWVLEDDAAACLTTLVQYSYS
jgi:hypothetical protein